MIAEDLVRSFSHSGYLTSGHGSGKELKLSVRYG